VSARAGLPVVVHLGLVATVVIVGTLFAVRTFLSTDPPESTVDGSGPRHGLLAAWREPRTLLIGLLVLVMAFAEGTANDWIAVAFIDGHGVSEAAGAVAFGIFVAAMTVGRTVGTVALDRWGRVPVLLFTMLLAIAGSATTVLADQPVLALVGVAVWGVGASLGFPLGMSAAADDERLAAARVSVVASIGYTAFLAGPPILGLLGDRVGTLRALLVVPLLTLPALALVPATRRPAAGG
jgi:fucose permease